MFEFRKKIEPEKIKKITEEFIRNANKDANVIWSARINNKLKSGNVYLLGVY